MKFMHLSALALAGTFTVLAIGCEVEKRKAIYEKRCEKKSDATTTTTIPVFADDKDKKAKEPKKEDTDKKADTDSFSLPTNTDKEAEKKELLSDDTVTAPTKDDKTTVKASEKVTTLFKTIVLDDGKEFSAAIKLNILDEKSKTNLTSLLTNIRCADNLELAQGDLGVVLVGDGKLVVTKEVALEEEVDETPAIQLECISTEKKSTDLKGLIENQIKVGQTLKDSTLSHSTKDGKVAGDMIVSCHADSTKAALSGKNGLQLVKGTSVLLNSSKEKMKLYSCQ